MALSEPSWAQQLLLEDPWPGVIALAAGAAALWIVAGRRPRGSRKPWRLAAAAVAGLALAHGLLALTVQTAHERVDQLARDVVHATEAPIDWPTLDNHLAPDATLLGPTGATWLGRGAIEANLRDWPTGFRIDSHTLDETRVAVDHDADLAVSEVALRTHLTRRPGRAIETGWSLTWRRDDDRWRLSEIRWLTFEDRPAEQNLIPR